MVQPANLPYRSFWRLNLLTAKMMFIGAMLLLGGLWVTTYTIPRISTSVSVRLRTQICFLSTFVHTQNVVSHLRNAPDTESDPI